MNRIQASIEADKLRVKKDPQPKVSSAIPSAAPKEDNRVAKSAELKASKPAKGAFVHHKHFDMGISENGLAKSSATTKPLKRPAIKDTAIAKPQHDAKITYTPVMSKAIGACF